MIKRSNRTTSKGIASKPIISKSIRRMSVVLLLVLFIFPLMPMLAFADPIETESISIGPHLFESHDNQLDLVDAAHQDGIPVIHFLGMQMPLAPPEGYEVWSLFDLLADLTCVLLLNVAAIYMIVIHRRQNAAMSGMLQRSELFTLGYQKFPILIVSVILALIAAVLFFLTQDIKQAVVLFDLWSVIFGIVISTSLAAMILIVTRHHDLHKSYS